MLGVNTANISRTLWESPRLRLLAMTDDEERDRVRRGFWLQAARERRGWTQSDVAVRIGYSVRSASTVKMWEKGERDVPAAILAKLARLYGVPAAVLLNPEPTATERLDELAIDAGALEREDWQAEQGDGPDDAGGHGDAPRRLPR